MDCSLVCLRDIAGKYLHEVEAPATFGMYLCDCWSCAVSLRATGMQYPNTKVVVKFETARRQVFEWRFYLEWKEVYLGGDIREVFVMDKTGAPRCECYTMINCYKVPSDI